jgi:hypothetical protein
MKQQYAVAGKMGPKESAKPSRKLHCKAVLNIVGGGTLIRSMQGKDLVSARHNERLQADDYGYHAGQPKPHARVGCST